MESWIKWQIQRWQEKRIQELEDRAIEIDQCKNGENMSKIRYFQRSLGRSNNHDRYVIAVPEEERAKRQKKIF